MVVKKAYTSQQISASLVWELKDEALVSTHHSVGYPHTDNGRQHFGLFVPKYNIYKRTINPLESREKKGLCKINCQKDYGLIRQHFVKV